MKSVEELMKLKGNILSIGHRNLSCRNFDCVDYLLDSFFLIVTNQKSIKNNYKET